MLDRITEFLNALGIAAPDRRGWVTVVLTFIIAVLAAWLFNPGVRRFSVRVGWADKPNARRLNKQPLPNAGGLAIFAAVIVALVIATLIDPIGLPPRLVEVLAILLGGALLIMTGFIDDQYGLPPVFRLLVQILAALLLVSVDIRIDAEFGGSFSSAIGIVLTVIWIVAITNVVNFLDGVDGLAGGVSFITAMSLLAVSAQDQAKAAATLLLAALAGAALGFLRHNFPPSRIIMGDSGAYFFGFVLAASSILGDLKITTLFGLFPTVFFMLLPFLIPMVDTIRVIFRRLWQRKNPLSSPGKDHLHHRLLAHGLSQTRTTLILWGLTLVTNVVAMIVQDMSLAVTVTTAIAIIIFLTLVVLLRRHAHRRTLRREAAVEAAGDS
ncbi:MAG: undecaprenyl/decaprenyl-phosphate alpha-N-acetylglucosaminyl 1-phosphate transferase [Thermoleophilia bacterium]|nr:undecaprenyl/decaprenyl-phosphate alpha-N-acetylglucosaminyl 1-phosphate transferase [Thermoleophilia bacterium]